MTLLHMSSIKDVPPFSSLLQASPYQQILYVLLGLATYLALVSSLRFQRRQALHNKYSYYGTRQSMRTMADQDAWAIQKAIMQTEFPFIVLKSLQFALFRVSEAHPRARLNANMRRHMAFQPYPPCS